MFNFLFVSGTVVVICKANETLHFPLPPLRRLLTPSRRLFLCMLKIPVKFHFSPFVKGVRKILHKYDPLIFEIWVNSISFYSFNKYRCRSVEHSFAIILIC